jgi:hypothetical protein
MACACADEVSGGVVESVVCVLMIVEVGSGGGGGGVGWG